MRRYLVSSIIPCNLPKSVITNSVIFVERHGEKILWLKIEMQISSLLSSRKAPAWYEMPKEKHFTSWEFREEAEMRISGRHGRVFVSRFRLVLLSYCRCFLFLEDTSKLHHDFLYGKNFIKPSINYWLQKWLLKSQIIRVVFFFKLHGITYHYWVIYNTASTSYN